LCTSDLWKIDVLTEDVEDTEGEYVYEDFLILDSNVLVGALLAYTPLDWNDDALDDPPDELAKPFNDVLLDDVYVLDDPPEELVEPSPTFPTAVLHSDRSMSPSWFVSADRSAMIFASNASISFCLAADRGGALRRSSKS